MQLQLKNFLRLGLPLGSCLILCGFIETVISLYEACMDVISIFVIHWDTQFAEFMLETPSILILNGILFVQILADTLFLWVGAIMMGSKMLLISWMVVTTSSVVVLNIVWIHYICTEDVMAIDHKTVSSAIYTVTIYSLFYAYIISIGSQCLPHMKENLEELQPVGKGFVRIWKYFSRNIKNGAQLLLTSELILNIYFFACRKLPPVLFDRSYNGHEDDMSYPVVMEEYVIRGIRVVIAFLGLIIICKGKQRWVKYWCIPYLLTLFLSIAIFVYLMVEWVSEHEILTYGYLLYYSINILYRTLIFGTCLCYSYPTDDGDFSYIAEFA